MFPKLTVSFATTLLLSLTHSLRIFALTPLWLLLFFFPLLPTYIRELLVFFYFSFDSIISHHIFLLIYLLLLKRRKWKSEHACKQNQKEWKRKKDKRSREEKGIKNLFALIDIKYFIQLTIKFQKILQFMNLNRIFQPHSLVRIKQQWKPTEKEEKKSWKISLQY